jgi:hypothetical protein
MWALLALVIWLSAYNPLPAGVRAGDSASVAHQPSGLPFYRLEGLQGSMETPLPASTQWEIAAETAEWIEPIYQELIQQAAQGEVLHNDDTTMKILVLMGESLPRLPSAEKES